MKGNKIANQEDNKKLSVPKENKKGKYLNEKRKRTEIVEKNKSKETLKETHEETLSKKMKDSIFPNPCTYVKESTSKIIPIMSHVKIDDKALKKFVKNLLQDKNALKYPKWSETHLDATSVPFESLLRYLFVIDTLNYCFWPNAGYEYYTLAQNLYKTLKNKKKFFEIDNLIKMTPEQLKENIFKCDFCLLNERARMIREVFTIIKNKYNGQCYNFVKACNKDATKLVKQVVDDFWCFRDQAIYNGEQIFFYKRAQILVSDIYLAYLDIKDAKKTDKENDVINFTKETISQLTMFADYRVPQILRAKGILKYDSHLTDLVDNKKELAHGGKEEIEIRAATIQTVEQIKKMLKEHGREAMSIEVDVYLWEEGEKIKDKVAPHHRTLSIFY